MSTTLGYGVRPSPATGPHDRTEEPPAADRRSLQPDHRPARRRRRSGAPRRQAHRRMADSRGRGCGPDPAPRTGRPTELPTLRHRPAGAVHPAAGGGRRAGAADLRLTGRGRRLLVAVVVALLVLVAFGAGRSTAASAAGAAAGAAGASASVVTVGPTDTLWQLAAAVAPGADRRAVVERIMAMNGLRSPVLVPGQRLRVPARAAP